MPVRSSVERRRSVRLSAARTGFRLSFSRRARMKRSISVLAQAVFWTVGTGVAFSG